MKKILLINALILITGHGIAQTPKITGDFVQGLHCIPQSQSVSFQFVNSSTNQGGITNVKWEIKDDATGNVINTNSDINNNFSYTYLFSNAGTYRCVMTVAWGYLIKLDSMKVTVHNMPKFSFVKNTDSICPGEGVTFNYTTIAPFTKGMVKNVAWDFEDGGKLVTDTPTYNYQNVLNVESSYSVSLTITDTNQCVLTVDSLNYIFVRTKPVVRFAADNVYFCFGNTPNPQGTPVFTNYTDTGKAGVSNTCTWHFGDGATSTSEHNISHTYGPGNYNVTLIATNQYGCVDSLTRNNYISVKQLIPDFTVSDTILCSLPDTITVEGKDSTVYYNWLINGIAGNNATSRNHDFRICEQDEGIHTLKLTIEDIQAGGGICKVDTIMTLHFYNNPAPKIIATDTNECNPTHTVSFTNATQYPSWAEDFGLAQTNWNFRDGTNDSGHTTTHQYGTSAIPDGGVADGGYGDYKVMMTGSTPYGCPLDTVYQYIHIFRMHAVAAVVDPAPPAAPYGCAPFPVTLANIEDSLVSSSDIISFVWKWNLTGDNADTNDTTIGDISGTEQHIYTDTGKYNVYLTLTNKQGCVHNIFVQHIKVGHPPLTNFTFVSDTNCKSLLNIQAIAYDDLDTSGNLAKAWANEWYWLDKTEQRFVGDSTKTTIISPNETGEVIAVLVSFHNGCPTKYPVKKEGMGYICPPIAKIEFPDNPPYSGQPPIYCEIEEIPFINGNKGAIYQKWYAGDYFPDSDTAKHSKSPLMKYDTILKDFIQYDEHGNAVDTGGDWAFTYSETSASDYLMKGHGLVTLWLWAMNDSSVTNDPTHELFNLCGYCEHVATQDVIISTAKMNFTVSQDAICQGDSVRFYDSTQASVGLLGWGFKFDSAWNSNPDYLDMTLGEYTKITNYTSDPKNGNGQWLTFTKPNRYKLVLQDTCGYGCIKNDTLILDVLPRSIPRITTSIDGITYNYGRVDTICINSGGQYYLRDSSWLPHPYENAKITGWEWKLGHVRDTLQHPVLVQNSAGYYHLSLTVKNEFGCDSTGIFEYQLMANNILPRFSTPTKNVCNKAKISFIDETTVMPIPNNRNTLLKLHYDWGDGDTSVIYSLSGQRSVLDHTYNLPNLNNTVYIKLTATIIDPITYLPTGCKEEYIDSIVVSRPIAAFTDDGHKFPCPDDTNGVKGRTIQFTNQSQGENYCLSWNFGDIDSGASIPINPNSDPNPVHTYNKAGVYDVLLIVQDDNNCVDSMLKKKHVVILGPRGSVYKEKDTSNCKPLIVTFQLLVEQDPEFQPDSIAIHVEDGKIMVNKGDYYGLTRSRRHVYQTEGVYLPVYFLYKTVQFSGKDEICIIQIREEDTIYVMNCISVTLTVESNDPRMGSVTGGGKYLKDSTITIAAIPNTGYQFVQWNDGNTDNPRTITLTQDTTFTAIFEETIGITDLETSAISVYPNPTRDCIHIVLPNNVTHAVFTLYDMQGKELIRKEIGKQDMVSVNNLATGIYIYNVTTDKQKHTGKLIINK
ncbi:MAG: PKD domain-containing protein [Bacteroidales bacterium]|nr:PKD domain-containing protein [Bacteroidales bacterium]